MDDDVELHNLHQLIRVCKEVVRMMKEQRQTETGKCLLFLHTSLTVLVVSHA